MVLYTYVVQAVRDALALRGLEGGDGFMTTADPRTYMSPERLTAAREVLRLLPPGASIATADEIANEIAPRLTARRTR